MKFERKEIVGYDVEKVRCMMGVRYWEDATVNGKEDTDGEIPLRKGDTWDITIDLDGNIAVEKQRKYGVKMIKKIYVIDPSVKFEDAFAYSRNNGIEIFQWRGENYYTKTAEEVETKKPRMVIDIIEREV